MIGIFDSGSGGLTVLKKIREKLPNADIVYFGDIKNAPYGTKTAEELGALTTMAVSRLLKEGATKIVSACNSVSATIVLPMLDILEVPRFDMIEMVGPTVKSLKAEKGKILLIATPATVASGIYQRGFALVNKKIEALAMDDLAGAIEFGQDKKVEEIIQTRLKEKRGYDLLILGCTHYPLVREKFEEALEKWGVTARVIDPAELVAEDVKKRMEEIGTGRLRLIISQESELFRKRVKELLGNQKTIVQVL